MPAQPVVELAVACRRCCSCCSAIRRALRLGTFLLRVLDFGQHRAPLLFEKRQRLLLVLLAFQQLADPLAQFGELLLLVGKLVAIGEPAAPGARAPGVRGGWR
jgi:hypothetical protein